MHVNPLCFGLPSHGGPSRHRTPAGLPLVVAVQVPSCVQLFATLWTSARQASLSFTISRSLLKLTSFESVKPSNHLVLCFSLLLLPSIFPSIRVFSNELALCIRWTNYWSFSFSISSSNEYSGLISFRMGWFDFLAVQETLKSLLQQSINSLVLSHACIHTHTHTYIQWINTSTKSIFLKRIISNLLPLGQPMLTSVSKN